MDLFIPVNLDYELDENQYQTEFGTAIHITDDPLPVWELTSKVTGMKIRITYSSYDSAKLEF